MIASHDEARVRVIRGQEIVQMYESSYRRPIHTHAKKRGSAVRLYDSYKKKAVRIVQAFATPFTCTKNVRE